MPVSRSSNKRVRSASPTRRAKARGNFSPNASQSMLKNLPSDLLSKVLNHASPESIRRVSQVNRSLRSVTKPWLGLRASTDDIVYVSNIAPPWGVALYKRRTDGGFEPLQKPGTAFRYYNSNNGRFYQPIWPNPIWRRQLSKMLGLKRKKNLNNHNPHPVIGLGNRPGHSLSAFKVP
jgi:hypothetical protein